MLKNTILTLLDKVYYLLIQKYLSKKSKIM